MSLLAASRPLLEKAREPVAREATGHTRRSKAARVFLYGVIAVIAAYSINVVTTALFTGAFWITNPFPTTTTSSAKAGSPFDFPDINATKHLQYVPCLEYLCPECQCARLELPMDWISATSQPSQATIGLAVIRYPAAVPLDDPRYGGTVVVNPGGPGGSGVMFVASAGHAIQQLLKGSKEAEAKYYDILSFDPRGVSFTTPRPQCIGVPAYLPFWNIRVAEAGVPGSSDTATGQLFSMAHALGGACGDATAGGLSDITQYMSTVSVARDMLALVERDGEWRHDQRQLLAMKQASDEQPKEYDASKEKMLYWGFSYGTLLGATFASLFPDRISRMVLDGVVDMPDYYQGNWSNNLEDTEALLQVFYETCAAAGPSKCTLAKAKIATERSSSPDGASAKEIKARVDNLLKSLKASPLPSSDYRLPEMVTYSDVQGLLLQALYAPSATFEPLAQILTDLIAGDASLLARALVYTHSFSCEDISAMQEQQLGLQAQLSIICTDAADLTTTSLANITAYIDYLATLSPTLGRTWGAIHLACTGFPVRPKWRLDDGEDEHTKRPRTATPILWVGNTLDPVTPLGNARRGASRFPGSGLLHINGTGHCSLAAYSACAVDELARYFREGTVREYTEKGEVLCQAQWPFAQDTIANSVGNVHALAVDQLSRALHESGSMLGKRLVRGGQMVRFGYDMMG